MKRVEHGKVAVADRLPCEYHAPAALPESTRIKWVSGERAVAELDDVGHAVTQRGTSMLEHCLDLGRSHAISQGKFLFKEEDTLGVASVAHHRR